jgi:regulator of replication initiation timing
VRCGVADLVLACRLEKQVTMYKEKMLELQRAVENSHEENKRLQAENRLLRINLQQA